MTDKSQHTVTVPREYLEKLENFYEENIVANDNNIKGVITKQGHLNALVLFNGRTDIPVDRVIIVDKDGKESSSFILDKKL